MLNLLIMGKPGAGKGTQAAKLLKFYHLTHISTGDIYRREMKKGSDLGRLAQEYMKNGELVPDDITNNIVEEVLNQKKYPHGFMLDGYPRTRSQAEALDRILSDLGIKLNAVINVHVSDKVLLERMAGRRVCPNCGETYHVRSQPPVKEGICDVCVTPLIQREDDLEKSVLNRLNIYNRLTKPLLDYYREKGLLLVINGEGSAQSIFKELVTRLGDY
jgi:adenylate kinase